MHVLGIDVGRKNLAMCLVRPGADAVGKLDRVVRWAVVAIDPTPAGVMAGVKAVDDWVEWSGAEDRRVVIEKQPAKNPTTKRLEHYLEMLFVSRGVRATTIDPKHKLSWAARTPWWPSRPIDSWTYGERKKLAVETVTALLAGTDQDPSVVGTFAASKKKDDLADSCLHAMAFAHDLFGRVDDDARAPARRVKPVAPSATHVASGRYSQGGLKHLSRKALGSREAFDEVVAKVPGFSASCVRLFGSVDEAYVQLGGSRTT